MQPSEPPIQPLPEAKRPINKRLAIFIGAGVLVAVVGVILIVSLILGPKKSSQNADTSSTNTGYYDREGYDRGKLPTSIGDPAPLVAAPVATPVHYAGQPVIQACNLLTLDDLQQAKLLLAPNSISGPSRHYFDGKGQATLPAASPYGVIPESDETNNCHYLLDDTTGITIGLFQPAYSAVLPTVFTQEISKNYQPQPDVNGSKVFANRKNTTIHYYMVQNGEVFAQLTFIAVPGDDPNGNAAKVINVVTKNLAAQLAHPTGPAKIIYKSPLVTGPYANSCDLTDNTDFKKIFGIDASPLVQEEFASAIGTIQYKKETGDPTRYNYIRTECTRESVRGDIRANNSGISVEQKSLSLRAESYSAAKAAENSYQSSMQRGTKLGNISAHIGDEATFVSISRGDPSLMFRKGRYVITISMAHTMSAALTAQQMIAALSPVAQKIAHHLTN